MNLGQILRTVFEMALIGVTLWAVFHEDIFVAFEERIAAAFKRRKLKVIDRSFSVIR